ncbi:MAG: NADH-quinone oxidoreductase subunit C [Bacteroidetes bacterium]|nr:NADH-quinone oxidoreductase subunit C [Bacteroidota bacterium]
MTFAEICSALEARFPQAVLARDAQVPQPWLQIDAAQLPQVCLWLRDTPGFYFDHLACLSGVDMGPEAGRMQVVYHLTSLTQGHTLVLKVEAARGESSAESAEAMPRVPSVSAVWRAADWHERETYDLLGIFFDGHPDMRRILMPADWQGHPMRKDYQDPDSYHDIALDY